MELGSTASKRALSLQSPNLTGGDVKAWQRILLVMQKKVTLDLGSDNFGIQALALAANALLSNANRQRIFDLAQDDFFDGIFGRYTSEATKAYQRSLGVKDDGVVGPLTAEKHNERLMAAKDLDDDAKDELEFIITGDGANIIDDIPGGKKTIGAGMILAIGAALFFFLKGKGGKRK